MNAEWPHGETENEILGLLADLGARTSAARQRTVNERIKAEKRRTEREMVDEALAGLGVPPLTSETHRFTGSTEETP